MRWIDECSGLDGMNAGLTQQWLLTADCFTPLWQRQETLGTHWRPSSSWYDGVLWRRATCHWRCWGCWRSAGSLSLSLARSHRFSLLFCRVVVPYGQVADAAPACTAAGAMTRAGKLVRAARRCMEVIRDTLIWSGMPPCHADRLCRHVCEENCCLHRPIIELPAQSVLCLATQSAFWFATA